MDDETAREMDSLLAEGELSGPEAEAMLQRVLASVDRKQRRPVRVIRYWAGAGAVLAAAAAVMLVVYLPREPGGRVHVPESGDLLTLRVTCSPGSLAACPRSSSLVFSVSDERASGYLSAYAEPIGHDGERVWYFSKEDGSGQLAAAAEGSGASQRAVYLSGLQQPGRYWVNTVLADRPLSRAEMITATSGEVSGTGIRAKSRVEVVVTD